MSVTDHWTDKDHRDYLSASNTAARDSLARAANELVKVAAAIEALPERQRRKLTRAGQTLNPALIRNEAERARDTWHVFALPA